METPLRILVLEDNPADYRLVEHQLTHYAQPVFCRRVASAEELKSALDEGGWDLVLSDYSIPSLDFEETLQWVLAREPNRPIILFSGSVGEERAVELLKRGVSDFVLKDNLQRLIPAIHRSLRDAEERRARRAMEAELRESEERYRQLFEAESDAIFLIDSDSGQLLDVNGSALELYSYSRSEFLGLKLAELSADPETMQRSLAAEHRRIPLAWHRKKDGSVFPVEITAGCFESRGRRLRVMAIRDISERRQTEAAVRQWADAFQRCAHGIALVLPGSNHLLAANPAFARLLGSDPEQVTEGSILDFFQPDDHGRVLASVEAADQTGQVRFEAAMLRRDGSAFPVQMDVVSVRGPEGQTLYRVATAQDISDRRQALVALHQRLELQDQLSRVVAIVPGVIYTFRMRPDGTFCLPFATPAISALFGVTPDEVRDSFDPAVERIHPEDRRQVQESVLVSAHNLKPWRNTFRVCHPDKGERWLEGHSLPRQDPDGGVLWHGFIQDITERKQLESQFRQAQKLEAVGQLAGGVAHDFNNILAAILMQLGLLEMNPSLDAEVRHALKELDAGARRAANLTRQLLMFSRRSVLAAKPLDLNEVVANLLKMLTRLIGEHITLRFEPAARLPAVVADAGMMEQVLMNLVVNARDAMPKGGCISIATNVVGAAETLISVNAQGRQGAYACLSVSDTGCGMERATLKRIFEPFFTTKEAGKGTGLGLATVHGIVAQHNGWVDVESEPGVGSVFRVYLPVAAKGTAAAVVARDPEPVQRGQETILLAEDELTVRQLIGQTLRALGYQVIEAANGQEAMSQWQIHSPRIDLLFTDMVMPEGITGLELAEQLQSLKRGLKVIISSGYSSEIVQAGVPNMPGVVYLPKPFESKLLARIVRESLDR